MLRGLLVSLFLRNKNIVLNWKREDKKSLSKPYLRNNDYHSNKKIEYFYFKDFPKKSYLPKETKLLKEIKLLKETKSPNKITLYGEITLRKNQ